jgi:hypothetical protein
MHGLVSLLPNPQYQSVAALWDGLEARFGLKGVRITPYPHFSWNIAKDYSLSTLRPVLETVVREYAPLTVHTTGLGVFEGPQPVIFIKIQRNDALDALHVHLWQAVQDAARDLSDYYSPPLWQPHITLAYGDLSPDQVPAVLSWLEGQESFIWHFTVDHISFIFTPDDEAGQLRMSLPLIARTS